MDGYYLPEIFVTDRIVKKMDFKQKEYCNNVDLLKKTARLPCWRHVLMWQLSRRLLSTIFPPDHKVVLLTALCLNGAYRFIWKPTLISDK